MTEEDRSSSRCQLQCHYEMICDLTYFFIVALITIYVISSHHDRFLNAVHTPSPTQLHYCVLYHQTASQSYVKHLPNVISFIAIPLLFIPCLSLGLCVQIWNGNSQNLIVDVLNSMFHTTYLKDGMAAGRRWVAEREDRSSSRRQLCHYEMICDLACLFVVALVAIYGIKYFIWG